MYVKQCQADVTHIRFASLGAAFVILMDGQMAMGFDKVLLQVRIASDYSFTDQGIFIHAGNRLKIWEEI